MTRQTKPAVRRSTPRTRVRAAIAATALGLASAGAGEQAEESLPDTLTGSWHPRTALEDRGITPFAVLTTEAWGNVAGGLQRHGWWNSLLDWGIELDTTRLGWWEGGHFMVQAHWVRNSHDDRSFADYTGAFNPVSGIMAGDHVRIYNLHYRHAWGEDKVVLKLGQIAADDDFMGSDYSALFLNSAFGAMPSQVGTPLATAYGNPMAFPVFPVATPGLFAQVRASEAFSTQAGFYYGRPCFDEHANYGFDWAGESPAELGLFWESAYRYKIGTRPATARLGLSYHTGPVDDFSGGTAGDPPATRQSVPNLYLIHDFDLLADKQGKTKLGIFARGGFTPEPDRSMVALYADAGLNWFGPLPSREDDIAGIALSHTQFGRDFRRYTGPEPVSHGETTLELTYRARITRWMNLQADAQFLFNPAVDPASGTRETAMVLGVRAEIRF